MLSEMIYKNTLENQFLKQLIRLEQDNCHTIPVFKRLQIFSQGTIFKSMTRELIVK